MILSVTSMDERAIMDFEEGMARESENKSTQTWINQMSIKNCLDTVEFHINHH